MNLRNEESQFIEVNFDEVAEEEAQKDQNQQSQFIEIDFDTGVTEELPKEASQFIEVNFDEVGTEETPKDQNQQPQIVEIDFGTGVTEELPKEASQFIEVNFDEVETKETQKDQNQQPQIVEIDFGTGVTEELPKEASQFIEVNFDEVETKEKLDKVLFFVSGEEKGLALWVKSLSEEQLKSPHSITHLYVSNMEVVSFDSRKYNKELELITDGDKTYSQQIIMVDELTFLKIALQGIISKKTESNNYFVVDIKNDFLNLRKTTFDLIANDDILNEEQMKIYLTALDVCSETIMNLAINRMD